MGVTGGLTRNRGVITENVLKFYWKYFLRLEIYIFLQSEDSKCKTKDGTFYLAELKHFPLIHIVRHVYNSLR